MIETIRAYIKELQKTMLVMAVLTFILMIIFYFADLWKNELLLSRFGGVLGMIFSLAFGCYIGLLIAIELIKKDELI